MRLSSRLAFHARYQTRRLLNPSIVDLSGVRLRTNSVAVTPKVKSHIYKGFYEGNERAILDVTLDPDDIVLDVGGGLGFIGAYCALRAKRVEIVEANPRLIPVIEDTLRLNGASAVVHNAVLGEAEGAATFHVMTDFWASSLTPQAGSTPVEVPEMAASELMHRLKPTYLVMDIEGGEAELLPKMPLETVRSICLEIHPWVVGETAISDMIAAIEAQGFKTDEAVSKRDQRYFSRA